MTKRRVVRWSLLTAGLVGLFSAQLVGPGPRALAQDASVEAGSAIATSAVLGAVPIVGNTTLSVTSGDSSASYQQSETRSSSQTVDLGGLGVILANTPFCGQIVLPANEQPQPLTDDSDGGPPKATNGSVAVGVESVSATTSPETASATTTPVGADIPGLLDVGGQSVSVVSYVPGQEREAQSSSQINLSIANGLVDLRGMTWTATQRSGTTSVSQGTFTVGSVTVGALTLPTAGPSQIAGAVALANKVLGTLGLTLILPTVTTDPATGTVTVTPLEMTLGKSALSDAVVSPLISQVSSLESEFNGQTATGSDCSQVKELESNLANPAETVVNVALGAFSNGGGFDLDLGGATADTMAPPDFADPFGSSDGTATTGALPPGSFNVPTAGSGVTFPASAANPLGGAGSSPTTTSSVPAQSASSAQGELSSATHCETTSPADHPGCWTGAASIVGAIAVLAGGALFLADFRRGRRSRRPVTKEATT